MGKEIAEKFIDTYSHPYRPYQIQLDFMDAINEVLSSNYKIGIFESPTGTGKTLSLICSTMTWLRKKNLPQTERTGDRDDLDSQEPAWVNENFNSMMMKNKKSTSFEYEKHLDDVAANPKLKLVRNINRKETRERKRLRIEVSVSEEDQFIPDDYRSDQEDFVLGNTLKEQNDALNIQIRSLMNKLNQSSDETAKLLEKTTKIYYSSRTHSQLNQFSSQLRLPNFPSSIPNVSEHLKYTPLGSRKQLCINDAVTKLKDVNLMNDRCLEMQKQTSTVCCKYSPNQRDSNAEQEYEEFRDSVFAKVHDIEDITSLGKHFGVCPYYAARRSLPYSEVVTLPYQLLLQKTSREALGVSLKGSVIIIDEAHNLLDAITSIHSVSVTQDEFKLCKRSLRKYTSKFSRRLNGGNRINLMKMMKMIDILAKYIQDHEKVVVSGKEISLADIFNGTTGDLLNVHHLEKYLTRSKIAYKIESYISNESEEKSRQPLLFKVVDFLKALSNPSREGKFFFDVNNKKTISMNYMLLDPSSIFEEIVNESKCVILAGGTMEPMEDYANFLFPNVDDSKIKKFSCGHVIAEQNLEVFVVDGNDSEFEFSYDRRNDLGMIEDLGRSIISLAREIPSGIVIFVPSYKYQSQITEHWKRSCIWRNLNQVKRVFSESSSHDVLTEYSQEIALGKGAVLISVVGGKLSEGINFSDSLARAVIMVGLPFPNAFSGEIISKRKYIEDKVYRKTKDKRQSLEATKSFYENICMKAVNQSVGRAIRHVNDYSTIYLFDKRYKTQRIESKLSTWIRKRIRCGLKFQEIVDQTHLFFKDRNT